MRRLLAFTMTMAFFIGSFAGVVLAQTERATSSVNLAGEQRMLSQRIPKLYSQIGLNVLPSLAASQLRLATSRFEGNLAALKPVVAGSAEATRAYERLGSEWSSCELCGPGEGGVIEVLGGHDPVHEPDGEGFGGAHLAA